MKRALTLLALVATHAAMAGPNLLVNGGFESTSVANGGWVIVTSMPGWTWLGGAGTGFEIRNNNAGAAQEGRNFIELDTTANTMIGQYVDNLSPGIQLDLSFWYSPREYQPASTNGIQVFWNGVQIADTLTGDGGVGNVWRQQQYVVTSQAGRNLLSFAAVGTSDSVGGSLDNVAVVNRVPEPGTLALTLAALASAWWLPHMLRRQARQRRATALASALQRDA